jgi:hypothetical protein
MSFLLQIDYYAEGEWVLTLAPGLVILVSDKSRQPAEGVTKLPDVCSACKEHLHTLPLDPALQSELYSLVGRPPFTYLACGCLCVVFSAALAREGIQDRWREFRKLQNRVLAWTVHN